MTVSNTAPGPFVVQRGKPVKLGTITAVNDNIKFAVPQDSDEHRGQVTFQAIGNGTITTLTADIQVALDGTTYVNLTGATGVALGGGSGVAARANLDGIGGGIPLRINFSAVTLGTATAVDIWAALA